MKSFFSLSPSSLAVGVGRTGTSIVGVLMLGLAVIRISLINMSGEREGKKYVHEICEKSKVIMLIDEFIPMTNGECDCLQ